MWPMLLELIFSDTLTYLLPYEVSANLGPGSYCGKSQQRVGGGPVHGIALGANATWRLLLWYLLKTGKPAWCEL